MSGTGWTVKYNKRTGDPYYVDSKGNVSWKKPAGYEPAPPPQRKRSGLFSGRGMKLQLQQETALQKPKDSSWIRGEGWTSNKSKNNANESGRSSVKSWKKPSTLSGVNQFPVNQQKTPEWVRDSNTSNGSSYRNSTKTSWSKPKPKSSTPSWVKSSNVNQKFSNTPSGKGSGFSNNSSNARMTTPSWKSNTFQGIKPANIPNSNATSQATSQNFTSSTDARTATSSWKRTTVQEVKPDGNSNSAAKAVPKVVSSKSSTPTNNNPLSASWKSSTFQGIKPTSESNVRPISSAVTSSWKKTTENESTPSTPSWLKSSVSTDMSSSTMDQRVSNDVSKLDENTNSKSLNIDSNNPTASSDVLQRPAGVDTSTKKNSNVFQRMSQRIGRSKSRGDSFPQMSLKLFNSRQNASNEENYNSSVKPVPPPKPIELRVGYSPDEVQVEVDIPTEQQRIEAFQQKDVKAEFNQSISGLINANLEDTFANEDSMGGEPPLPKKPKHLKDKKIFGAVQQSEESRYDNNFQYTFLAHNLGYVTGYMYILMGGFAILWYWRASGGFFREFAPPANNDVLVSYIWSGPYSILLGVIIVWFESFRGLHRNCKNSYAGKPHRGIGYIITSGPCFASYATILPACVAILCGIANLVAASRREVGIAQELRYGFRGLFNWDRDRGTYIIGVTYITLNVVMFIYNYVYFEFIRNFCILDFGSPESSSCISFFAPIAKGFGQMLNLNCAIILLPVLRRLLRRAAEKYDRNNIFPFKKAIEFHKIIGFVTSCSVFGHVFCHYLNFAFKSEISVLTFGNAAYISGGVITLAMCLMFSGAHYAVRRANYEIFWSTHHFYVVFYLGLLCHAPHFWQWFLIPVILFYSEKKSRAATRGQRKIYVESVQFIPPVLNINFSPEKIEDFDFRGGQYLYMLVPAISEREWHPFSMSSAYGDLEAHGFVSVHIRVQEPGSWTFRLKEYFRLIAGQGGDKPQDPFVCNSLHHYDAAGNKKPGLHNGPDGKPLLLIDGPYASPTQVYSTYRDIILVGSGIGLTPSASILRSVLRHKWKKGYYPETIRFCWLLRHNEVDSFHWFIELLADLSERVASDRLSGAIDDSHYLELNIYVTGTDTNESFNASKTIDTAHIGSTLTSHDSIHVDPNQLRKQLLNPTIDAKDQAEIQIPNSTAPNRMEDIWIWRGRSNWETVFRSTEESIINRRKARGDHIALVQDESEVGVCFCGHPVIGKALKQHCSKFSKDNEHLIKFTLNAEVF